MLETLLSNGLNSAGNHAWKCFALLTKLFYELPQCRPTLTSLLLKKYARKMGRVLDSLHDFQLANYLVELLANAFPQGLEFPNKSILLPKLWQNQNKNVDFFNSKKFPRMAKHGEKMLIDYVIDNLGPFDTFGSISNVSCGSLEGKCHLLFTGQGYIQFIGKNLYIWNDSKLLLQMRVDGLDVMPITDKSIKLIVLDVFESVVMSLDTDWLQNLKEPECFYITFEETRLQGRILEATKFRKVSEVESFISLNFNSSSEADTHSTQNSATNSKPLAVMCAEDHIALQQSTNAASRYLNEKSQIRIHGDDWDIEPSSHSPNQEDSPDDMQHVFGHLDYSELEKSPVVMMQTRRKLRAHSKALRTVPQITNQIGLNAEIIKRIPETRTKQNSKNMILQEMGRLTPRIDDASIISLKTPLKSLKSSNSKGCSTINKRDISALETIFGSGQKDKKRHKQQTKGPSGKITHESSTIGKKPSRSRKQAPRIAKSTIQNNIDVATEKRIRGSSNHQPQNSPAKTSELEEARENSTHSDNEANSKHNKNAFNIDGESGIEKPTCDTGSGLGLKNAAESTSLEATTVISGLSGPFQEANMLGSSFTNKLQEQIFSSITNFSNELAKKITIINEELNKKICRELSDKYLRMFDELQSSFESDVAQMSQFVGEIGELLHLSEERLIEVIREKQFH